MYVEVWWRNLCENVHLEDCKEGGNIILENVHLEDCREAGKIILTWVFV
jgi:hypothetical protein